MEVNKHNICEIIETCLKEKRLRFNIIQPDEKGVNYEIYIGSSEANIQVEYDLTNPEDNYMAIQFYTEINDDGNSFYESVWESDSETCDSIEGEIESLIEEAKNINKALSKIRTKLEQIREIAEECGIIIEKILTYILICKKKIVR